MASNCLSSLGQRRAGSSLDRRSFGRDNGAACPQGRGCATVAEERLDAALLRPDPSLLDPSESLQISLQIPTGETAEDWELWLEACNRQLSVPLRQWLESQGIEQSTLRRLTGNHPSGQDALKISNMLQVAHWLQNPIEAIETLAETNGSQLVLHLAGLGPSS